MNGEPTFISRSGEWSKNILSNGIKTSYKTPYYPRARAIKTPYYMDSASAIKTPFNELKYKTSRTPYYMDAAPYRRVKVSSVYESPEWRTFNIPAKSSVRCYRQKLAAYNLGKYFVFSAQIMLILLSDEIC